MSTVNSVFSVPGGTTPTDTTRTPSSTIDQEGFLRLLVAQLQNQDPMEPLTNEEFVQQLTSFSSLDELREIKEGMEGLGELSDIADLLTASLAFQQTNVNAMSVGLIGKEVEVESDSVQVGGAGDEEIVFDLPSGGAEQVTLRLKGESGQMIYETTFDPTNPPEGVRVENGRVYVEVPDDDGDGNPLPTGTATIEAVSISGGESTTLETGLVGTVTGIDFRGQTTLLTVGSTSVELADVLAVRGNG